MAAYRVVWECVVEQWLGVRRVWECVVAAYHVVWECVVEQWLGVRRTTHTAHLATAPQHNMICCHNNSFANTN